METAQTLLDEFRAKRGVVGATLGILEDGNIETAASGVLNLDTKVEATPDSVFQIGSIGKIFTTTLIMQLVDAGRLTLDDPVVKHLPDFSLADTKAARTITVRQLLNHTSGIDGDFFPRDDLAGPSASSYVRKMYLLPSLYPPGQGPMTYCNAGFVVAGRIIEILTGMTWPRAVVENIGKPLGLTHYFTSPHEALRYRCAMGHISEPDDISKTRVAPATFLSLSAAAAGSVLSMSVESLLKFAAVHMADGRYGDDKQLISQASAKQMRDDFIEIPKFTHAGLTHWGLGWMESRGLGYSMVGHDGGTLGQFTYLRTYPERKTAFTLLTNSPSLKLIEDIEKALMPRLAGVPLPSELPREDFKPVAARYVGRYESVAAAYRVEEKDGALTLNVASKLGAPEVNATLEPYRPHAFAMHGKGLAMDGQKMSFLGGDGDRPFDFIRIGTRMGRRVR